MSAPNTTRPPITSIDFMQLIQGPPASIFVGHERTLFSVPKALLCYHSRYFRGALNNDFVEAQKGVVELKDEDAECFQYIVGWMYRGTLGPNHYYDATDEEKAISFCSHLCHIYYLADLLRVEELMAQLLPRLGDLFDHYRDSKIIPLNSDLIIDVYENTPDTSPLRAGIIDELARLLCDSPFDVDIGSFDACFLQLEGFGATLVDGVRTLMDERVQSERTQARQPIPTSDPQFHPFVYGGPRAGMIPRPPHVAPGLYHPGNPLAAARAQVSQTQARLAALNNRVNDAQRGAAQ